jgi:UDP-N-acetylmuramate: L-alanyl-gamma-D-glutamyl-meso-diaminopimelate ligase
VSAAPEPSRRLALGQREIVDAFLGHDARRCGWRCERAFLPARRAVRSLSRRFCGPSPDNSVVHLHILGICGTFMGGIAALAQQAGHRVTGCDANVYPPMSEQLARSASTWWRATAQISCASRPTSGSSATWITAGNPLMEAILDRAERYQSGPQWLADQVLVGKWVLAVAGNPRQRRPLRRC